MKILIVDDEVVSRKKMQKILTNFGACNPVEDGETAIAAIKKAIATGELFHLITLDVEMPGITGTQVLLEIKKLEKQFKISKYLRAKVLMVTSHSDKDTVMASIQAGCDDYVVKPFNREDVEKKLNKLGFHSIRVEHP